MKTALFRAWLLAAAFGFVAVAGNSLAAEFTFQSETIFRSFERELVDGSTEDVLPIYEYLAVDGREVFLDGLSIHAWGWGRYDLGDTDFFDDQSAGEIGYAYLDYLTPGGVAQIKLGRHRVFRGVSNEDLDGLSFVVRPLAFLSFSAFGGLPVALAETSGTSGDIVAGGRVGATLGRILGLGISYKQLRNDSETEESFIFIDGTFSPIPLLSIDGYSSYNEQAQQWGEHRYEGTLFVGALRLVPFFEHFNYEGFFGTGQSTGSPFRLLDESDETLTSYGGSIVFAPGTFSATATVKGYEHDQSDRGAGYASLLVSGQLASVELGLEAGLMDGDVDENRYTLSRLFFFLDRSSWFLSGDGLYVHYYEEILGEDASIFSSLGAGLRLGEGLELKFSGDYSTDPYFDEDVRAMATVTYTYK